MKNIYTSSEVCSTFYPSMFFKEGGAKDYLKRIVKYTGKGHPPKPHWKKTQSEEERYEKLKAAEEKRQRKLSKRRK